MPAVLTEKTVIFAREMVFLASKYIVDSKGLWQSNELGQSPFLCYYCCVGLQLSLLCILRSTSNILFQGSLAPTLRSVR